MPPAKNAAKPAGEWNHFTIRCQGGKVVVTLNGTVVNELPLDHDKIKTRPATGYIGFQDHALPLKLRNLKIRERRTANRTREASFRPASRLSISSGAGGRSIQRGPPSGIGFGFGEIRRTEFHGRLSPIFFSKRQPVRTYSGMPQSPETNPKNDDDNDDRSQRFVVQLNASHRSLLAYLVSLLGNRHDAEDVLHASVTMWRRFATFETGTDFLAWASTVAFYEARNFQRVAARSRPAFQRRTAEDAGGRTAARPVESRTAARRARPLPRTARRSRPPAFAVGLFRRLTVAALLPSLSACYSDPTTS